MLSFALASRVFLQPVEGRDSSLARYHTPGQGSRDADVESKGKDAISVHNAPRYEKPVVTPYGDDWDVLWLGHCGTELPSPPPEPPRAGGSKAKPKPQPTQLSRLQVTIPNDITVPVPKHLKPHPFALQDALGELFPPHTRVVHAATGTLCTQAYAVSQRGARKLLYQFGLETFTTGWDLMLKDWCDGLYMGKSGAKGETEPMPQCLTVQPPRFSHYLVNREGSSDIQAQGGGYLHKTGSQYIRLSVRKNFRKLVNGEPLDRLLDQWPDST